MRATLAAVGMGEDHLIPSYFFDGLRRILAGAKTPWVRLPEHEQGLGWVLCRLVDVLPGTSSEEVGAFDRFAVPALRRGVVVHRRDSADGYSEWYAVSEVDSSGTLVGEPAPRTAPSILGTFHPTSGQIRRWAYDRDLYFASQDEELAIDDVGFLPLLVELAGDPAGPKRDRLRQVIHSIGPGRVLTRSRRS